MTKNRKRQKKLSETDDYIQDGWPSWFIEPTKLVEREILVRALRNNQRLSEVHFTIFSMRMNYILFRRNYEELVKLQEEFNHPLIFNELALTTDRGQEIAQDTIIEFTQLLHNFLASAKMLVEVTRRWVRKKFEGSDFLNTYQREVSKRFGSNVQAQFLENLRNYTLHRTLPLAIPELRMQKVSENELGSSLGIVLLKDSLLEWDKWSKLGRIQISMAFEGEVDIQSIVEMYFDNVTEFTRWLFWQIRDSFSEEVDQIDSVIQQIREH